MDFPWTGSFSDARNESLRHATGEWILYLDADEHMVEGDGVQLREHARRPWVEGTYVVETHYTGSGEVGAESQHAPMRLFRRRPGREFEGIVHEQLLHAFPTHLPERFSWSKVRVQHYGYLKQVQVDRDKRERNLQLLQQQLQERRDSFTLFNIGSEHAAAFEWADARPYFEEALELVRAEQLMHRHQYAPMLVQRLVAARRGTGDPHGAIELAGEALGWWPEFTDLEFERALAWHELGNVEEMAAAASRCLELGDAPAEYVAIQGRGSHQARALLAGAQRELGQLAEARANLEQALAEAPHFVPTVLDLADVMLLEEPAEDVDAWFDEHLPAEADGPSGQLLLAAAFHEAGHEEQADRRYERVLAEHPGHPLAITARAELRLAQRRLEEAHELATTLQPTDRLAERAGRIAMLAAVVLGDEERVAAALALVEGAEVMPAPVRSVYTAWAGRVRGSSTPVLLRDDAGAATEVLEQLDALAKLEATDEFEQLHGLLEQVLPDERTRRQRLGALYVRRRFPDLAAEEYIRCVERFGPDAASLTGLGKVATMKGLWEDAEVFLGESLELEPAQREARRLLGLVQERRKAG